jgi:hypothetical protein
MVELRSASRWLAALLLAQIVIGPIANFTLLDETFGNKGGYLVHAASHPVPVAMSALLAIILAALSAGIALVMWPVLRTLNERVALAVAIPGTVVLALSFVESASLMSMLSLSQAYAAAGAPADALWPALKGVVGAHRNWAHLTQLLASGATLLALYAALFRLRLAPRTLAGFGMLAAASQMLAVAKPFFGGWVIFPMLAPIGVANLLLAGWLLWKPGFRTAAGGSS